MNDKPSLVKEKDATSERQNLGQLIMEEDVPPVDKVPKVELKIETESDEKRRSAGESNGQCACTLYACDGIRWPELMVVNGNECVVFTDKNARVTNDDKKIRNLPETATKVPINSVSE